MTDFIEKDCLELKTINDFLRFGYSWANQKELFYGHGTDNAWDDIRQLILGSLCLPYDIDPSLLNTSLVTKEKKQLYTQMEKRINQRIPVPYLIRQAYFCELPFYVDERVLIPRSPIAELITHQFSPWIAAENVHRILDMCTGSGCIAVACCYAFPKATVDAVDISSDALDVAQLNMEYHALEEQLSLIKSNCFENVPEVKYDIIVSNPPYVGRAEMASLPKEYTYEPTMALQAENNGLAIVENLLQNASRYLSEKGILVIEVGNSDELVQRTFPNIPFTWLEFEHGGHGVFVLSSQQLTDYFTSR
ncbi:50S ribosomal protein L3 N(5)-glutamine methyltransferase [Legionella israelensis]|uniref:N5-glutamine methyltransferase n=1 Tax=Legionella israelensis TaxID=454 RepID=A0A0W0WHW5_9GAMM|nr:50S ribosomal protein L3 N(5)-glutamine methyltransferase [Legionella israelensis]KTD31937.1 N5-glutamine methyltransferase [Legionella israelensis]QBS10743.1 50S ribosomal protein L3 N(5)-glutamine methyltransferase [Legionella israelensis]SCY28274.1 [LSU ribosomal protein L3P]-glutamine N5-methyltransferase [Legionella israelensis DSM 19235]STX57710.1 N5-glutamine methyltransferase [Legionella israelensis]